jgi:hypothetical protein
LNHRAQYRRYIRWKNARRHDGPPRCRQIPALNVRRDDQSQRTGIVSIMFRERRLDARLLACRQTIVLCSAATGGRRACAGWWGHRCQVAEEPIKTTAKRVAPCDRGLATLII